jgi:hypothetical protein
MNRLKVYDHTRAKADRLPLDILERMTRAAARYVKVTPDGSLVVFRMTPAYISGEAHECARVRREFIEHPSNWRTIRKNGEPNEWIAVHGGYIEINIGRIALRFEAIEAAENVFQILVHEWCHVADFREGKRFENRSTPSGRRLPHVRRPCERAVMDRLYKTRGIMEGIRFSKQGSLPSRAQEAILDFAIWIDDRREKRTWNSQSETVTG